jgi:hypothetical protein
MTTSQELRIALELVVVLMVAGAKAVVQAHPRTAHFKKDIIQAFYDGIKHRPETTFGNVKGRRAGRQRPSLQA